MRADLQVEKEEIVAETTEEDLEVATGEIEITAVVVRAEEGITVDPADMVEVAEDKNQLSKKGKKNDSQKNLEIYN